MQYPTCRKCGAFVQWEGSRCLICGFDPTQAPDPTTAATTATPTPTSASSARPGVPGTGTPGSAWAVWAAQTGEHPVVPPPPARRRSRMPLILGSVGVLSVIALVAAAGYVYLGRDQGPAHPDEWDPKVAGLAAFVEDERDLAFDEPVHVDFLSAGEYRERVTGGDEQTDGPTEAEAEELQDAVAGLRALGLVEGEVDLDQATDDLQDAGTLAFYDHAEERIVVRGTELTAALRVTLVHELTHALQDQHFDLERLEELEGDRGSYLRAVAEGDADRIEELYVDQLDDDDRASYLQDQEEDETESVDKLEETVPDVLLAFFAAPYIFGDAFVGIVHEVEGDAGIDGALQDPPTVDEVLFDPFTHFEDQVAADVAAPSIGKGAERLDAGDFGAVALYLVLSHRIDPHTALRAVDGWGGDEYVSYRKGSEVCTAIRFQGDEPEDTAQMADALDLWVATLPAGTATATREGERVLVRSCDPGADAAIARDVEVADLFALPAFRNGVATGVLQEGGDQELARCVSRRLVDRLSVAQMTDASGAFFESPDYQNLLFGVARSCRQ